MAAGGALGNTTPKRPAGRNFILISCFFFRIQFPIIIPAGRNFIPFVVFRAPGRAEFHPDLMFFFRMQFPIIIPAGRNFIPFVVFSAPGRAEFYPDSRFFFRIQFPIIIPAGRNFIPGRAEFYPKYVDLMVGGGGLNSQS